MMHRPLQDLRSPLFRLGVVAQFASILALLVLLAGLARGSPPSWIPLVALAAGSVGLGCFMASRSGMIGMLRRDADDAVMRRRDALTGALSRRDFVPILHEAVRWRRARPEALRETVALLLIDLDYLKKLNDSFGHAVGDQAIVHLVSLIEAVFPLATVGRLGGDEFAVMLRGGDPAEAEASANRLLERLRRPFTAAGRQIHLSASVGIALSPVHAEIAEDLLVVADLALYESKRRGRSCVTVFDRAMQAEERHRVFIERELRAAILLDHLDVHYQPQVDREGRLAGLEALARWRHPALGPVSPADFIPIAERTTLIDLLGEWVFRRVCTDLPRLPPVPISFNVSAAQLMRDELVETTRRLLREHDVAGGRFVAEITENVAVSAAAPVLARIEALRALGLRIALDDFGTGHCSFALLRAMPVDSIKIDKSYVRALGSDPVAGVFVAAVCETARLLGLEIVAEGVESDEDRLLATTVGCTTLQGFLFSPAVPVERLAAFGDGADGADATSPRAR